LVAVRGHIGVEREIFRRTLQKPQDGKIFSSSSFSFFCGTRLMGRLRLVTLQSCVIDTEKSLADIVSEIDKILEADSLSPLVCQLIHFPSYFVVHHR
jgi:hypothetical protein